MTLIVKPYSVEVYGFMPITYYAASPGKARAKAFREYCHAYPSATFHDFLTRSTVRKGTPGHGFGEKIMVGGEPAYRIPDEHRASHVAFVRPDSDVILSSHPLDVSTPI